MAYRPFTPAQQRQNARFLAALRRTGNVRLACRDLGVHRGTYTKRRGKCAAFATEWDMALAAAHAAFRLAGGERLPAAAAEKGTGTCTCPHSDGLKTKGGEPTIVRQANGRLQLRLAPPGRMTDAAEQLYLATLSASANIRLSAKVAGFAHTSFYARRWRDSRFAREERFAIQVACDRMEWALTMRARQALSPAWRSEGPDRNPLPKMTVDQCFQLVTMHHNAAVRHGGWGAWSNWRRTVEQTPETEPRDEAILRDQLSAERARHYEATGSWRLPDEPAPPKLPPLKLVTGLAGRSGGQAGWGAKAKVTYNADRALFGGWRLDTWEERKAGKG